MRSDRDAHTFTERARRTQIVEAACEVIAEVGYPNASLARIAERIGVAKSVVLYHVKTKDALVAAIVEHVMTASATAMIPALLSHDSAAAKLRAYIESNVSFMDAHRVATVAMFEIVGSYRTPAGLRFDQAITSEESTLPPPEMAMLDPRTIFELGISNGEFDSGLSPMLLRNALRAALDGAAAELARDLSYDVPAYGATLITVFDRATRRPA